MEAFRLTDLDCSSTAHLLPAGPNWPTSLTISSETRPWPLWPSPMPSNAKRNSGWGPTHCQFPAKPPFT